MEVWEPFVHPSEVWNDAFGGPFTKSQAKTVHREMERVRKSMSGPIRPIWDFAETRAGRKAQRAVTNRIITGVGSRGLMIYAASGSMVGLGMVRVATVGLRVVPILGWALLAYDVWTLGNALFGDDD